MQPHKSACSFNKLVFSSSRFIWLIGYYIAEYELSVSDRASYGINLLSELAKHLTCLGISHCNRFQLYRYLRFYRLYPEIMGTLPLQLKKLQPSANRSSEKVGTPSPQLQIALEQLVQRHSYRYLCAAEQSPMTRAAQDLGVVEFAQESHWQKQSSWNYVIRAMSDHRPVWFNRAYDAVDLD